MTSQSFLLFCHKRERTFFILAAIFLTIVLSGCGPESAVNADLYATDSMMQTLTRLFLPETYWEKKRAILQREVHKNQAAFKKRTKAYHELLQKRRGNVMQAMSRAQKAGTDPHAARREAIQALRDTMDPIREEARQLGKKLRSATVLLTKAEKAARQQ